VASTTKFNIENDRELQEKILSEVVRMENSGYQFEAAGASFDLLVKRCAGKFEPHFHRIKYHVGVAAETGRELLTEATVKLEVDGKDVHEVGEGDGPVNALDAALRKALVGRYPELVDMKLVDYRVRVVNSEAGTAARIRVIIESNDHHDVWGTVGVSENIIEASWIALVDAIEYKLFKGQPVDVGEPVAAAKSDREVGDQGCHWLCQCPRRLRVAGEPENTGRASATLTDRASATLTERRLTQSLARRLIFESRP
jgi:2-isopropylmalate synthase